jgi:hypothetical protein
MKYVIIVDEHELLAMREMVNYGRVIAQTFPDKQGDTFAQKIKVYAQAIEDVVERIDRIET